MIDILEKIEEIKELRQNCLPEVITQAILLSIAESLPRDVEHVGYDNVAMNDLMQRALTRV